MTGSSSNTELTFLKNQRKYYRAKATRNCNTIEADIANLSFQEKIDFRDNLISLKDKLDKLNNEVSNVMSKSAIDEGALEDELSTCDLYEDKLCKLIKNLDVTRNNGDESDPSFIAGNGRQAVSNQLKLPQIPLPEFTDHKTESLELFFASFECIINKYNLSQFEKYVFLERQLKNESLVLVKSLRTGQQSYDTAKELLLKAFASPIGLKFDIIERLIKLKLSFPGEPYKFISEMRTLIDSFTELEIDVETVLQYFIWNGLNDQFRNIMISISNETKPSLDCINENMFKATERYLNTVCNQGARPKTKMNIPLNVSEDGKLNSMAVSFEHKPKNESPNVKNKFIVCILCKNDPKGDLNHPLYKCKKYLSATDKKNKLASIGACTKCGNCNHSVKECRYQFKRSCRFCGKYHFDYLCSKSTFNANDANLGSSTVIINHSAFLSFEQCKKVILPTFTCDIGKGRCLRTMKDSGAQFSFVTSEANDKFKFKIVNKNVKINVNGFNSDQNLITDVVNIKARINNNTHNIMAIVVPKISTKITLPGLKNVAINLEKRNFVLADKILSKGTDTIENLDMILGSNANHCLPEETIVFGNNPPSSFIKTPIGMMLVGNIETLKSNMKYLSVNVTEFTGEAHSDERSNSSLPLEMNHIVVDSHGKLNRTKLEYLGKQTIEEGSIPSFDERCEELLDYNEDNVHMSIDNKDLISKVLENITRTSDGRMIVPLSWNDKVKHLLARNYFLAKQVLQGNLRKLKTDPEKLQLIDKSFREQLELGVIEKIPNLHQFMEEHPEACFLAHMPVFKLSRETTKCRNVFLSNVGAKDPEKPISLSNNQCMLAGPPLNHKISTSFIQLRFDEYLVCFDLVKAFLQIALRETDSFKLCFLWFRDVERNDFTVEGFRNVRLPFGLKCSPVILMLCLYKILIVDTDGDSEDLKSLKKIIYANFYMDNGAVTGSEEYVVWACSKLKDIFSSYGFDIQQVYSNSKLVQSEPTENIEESPKVVKILGMNWDRELDEISAGELSLNADAQTKREILRSIAANYDIYNINGPLLNRARLFMHKLQCIKTLDWDTRLDPDQLKVWKLICKQLNLALPISIPRRVGNRDDSYSLVAFTDSSSVMVGVVIYLYNNSNGTTNFLLAKNRIVGKNLIDKSIPSLELTSIDLGAKTLFDIHNELTGETAVVPLNITNCFLFSDSLVSLNWVNSYTVKLDKMKNKSVFVLNRLSSIAKVTETIPIVFKFCNGLDNPADCMTRELSYKMLKRSCFHNGPDFLSVDGPNCDTLLSVDVPNPKFESSENCDRVNSLTAVADNVNSLAAVSRENKLTSEYSDDFLVRSSDKVNTEIIDHSRYSSYRKILNVTKFVFRFIYVNCRKKSDKLSDDDIERKAFNYMISCEQRRNYADEFYYLNRTDSKIKDIPVLALQLNLFIDSDGLVRVKSKFGRFRSKAYCPLLMSKKGLLSKLLVEHYHRNLLHAGIYTVLNEVRKKFYIPSIFSFVKACIKNCFSCRKVNNRPVKLNQSSYRGFRVDPSVIPFRTLFLDYIGPFYVTDHRQRTKVYILLLTCLWSRGVNLVVSRDLSAQQFLRSFQIHCFNYGTPTVVHSDLGSQLVSASNIITNFIDDDETRDYFRAHNMDPLTFKQFPKGCKELGGIVESCVKAVKKLIHCSIGKSVLKFEDFEFLVGQTVSVINKRPIALKETLRDSSVDVPSCITPEIVIKGYELPSVNMIPELQHTELDLDWYRNCEYPRTVGHFSKLAKARNSLIKHYESKFLHTLIDQATNVKSRFRPVSHEKIGVGDLVLVKEENTKTINFPLGIILEVNENFLGEVTDVLLLKGITRERLKRHITSIIPLLSAKEVRSNSSNAVPTDAGVGDEASIESGRAQRRAAAKGGDVTREMFQDGAA